MNWPESPAFGSGGGTAAAAAAGGAAAGAAGHGGRGSDRPGAAGVTAAAAASGDSALGGDVAGRRPARVDLLLEPEVQVVLVRAVGEVAGPADRPRRADLVRPVLLRQLRQLAGELARGARAGVDDLAVDRPDVEPAAVGVVGDRATRRELRVVRAHARDLDLVVLGDLGHRGDHARVDLARLDVGDAVGVEGDVLVLEQLRALRRERAAVPVLAELRGIDRVVLGAAAGGLVGEVGRAGARRGRLRLDRRRGRSGGRGRRGGGIRGRDRSCGGRRRPARPRAAGRPRRRPPSARSARSGGRSRSGGPSRPP